MRQLCGAEPSGENPNQHSCYLNPHSPESKHECACGKRWMSPDSYGNVTARVKNSS